jgi:heavy metal sensor kinase
MLSLRIKLTVYYLAILSAVLLLFGIAIYFYLSRSLLTTIDESLAFQAERLEVRMAAAAEAETFNHQPAQGNENHEELLQLSPHVIQIIDDSGRVTENLSSPEDHLPVNRDALMKLEVGKTTFTTVKLESGEQLRVATRRARDTDGDGTYFIRLGQSLAALQSARRKALLVLGIAIPLALLLGSFGGLLLANQALSPVDRITSTADLIAKGDLTERVPEPEKMDEIGRLAATFNHMISRLQAAFERQKQFTSDASHELRTPLAVMRGDIEIALRRQRAPEEYQRVLTSNLEEILRLTRLIEDLLTLARADTGRVELRCEPIDLNQLCRQMVEYISPLAQQRNQMLSYEPPATATSGGTVVNADTQRIKQLLLNLLDNAIKYTEPGGQITLGLKTENSSAVITVADTGRGIPAEDLPHIFERFFRRSAKTSDRSASGFGLGLSIVKWIVDSHHGQIEAHNRDGKGTLFTVKLPLAT